MLMGDYWRNNVSTAETNARLILNKQCGGLKLLLMLRKVALQKPDAVSTTHRSSIGNFMSVKL